MGIAIPQVLSEDKASGAQIVDCSLRFDSSKSHRLARTFSGWSRTTWTWSGWVRRAGGFGSLQNIFNNNNTLPIDGFFFNTNSTLKYRSYNGSSEVVNLVTTQVFRDVSSWYHIVVALDTTNGTTANRYKLWINGQQVTSFSTASYPSSSYLTGINNNTVECRIGDYVGASTLDGLLSNLYFIDGQALDPSYFGYTDPLTNTWRP